MQAYTVRIDYSTPSLAFAVATYDVRAESLNDATETVRARFLADRRRKAARIRIITAKPCAGQ